MQVAAELVSHYRAKGSDAASKLRLKLVDWNRLGRSLAQRLGGLLEGSAALGEDSASLVKELATSLRVADVQRDIGDLTQAAGRRVYVLADKLDEGYEPDSIGIGFLTGLAHAAVEINDKVSSIHCVLFLRDNIFRSIERVLPEVACVIGIQARREGRRWTWRRSLERG